MKKKPKKAAAPVPEQQTPEVDQWLTTKEAAALAAFSPHTLVDWRTKTPKNYTVETMEAAAARGERIYLPFIKLGTAKSARIRYALRTVRIWMKLQPEYGRLPEAI
jgi:hypothetical protein